MNVRTDVGIGIWQKDLVLLRFSSLFLRDKIDVSMLSLAFVTLSFSFYYMLPLLVVISNIIRLSNLLLL